MGRSWEKDKGYLRDKYKFKSVFLALMINSYAVWKIRLFFFLRRLNSENKKGCLGLDNLFLELPEIVNKQIIVELNRIHTIPAYLL